MRQKNFLKLTAATFAIIGAGAFLFSAAAETAMAASAGTVETVPTSYQVSASQAATKSLQSAASPLPRESPSVTTASGSISRIVSTVPESPLPPLVTKGHMVFPERSAASR